MVQRTGLDLTEGPIGKKIILFSIPLLAGNLIQQLYNSVDLVFVGNFVGKAASAAIGTSHFMISFLVCFFSGLSVGSGVVIAHLFGGKNYAELSRTLHNTVALSLFSGVLLMALGYAVVPLYIRLINTPESLVSDATVYLQIYFLSLPWVSLYNQGSGTLRALGDGRIPMLAQLIGGVCNVGADYLFIRVFQNGISGVAWATLISQSVAALIILHQMSKLDERYAFRPKKIAFHLPTLKRVLAIGIPAGGQYLVIVLANAAVQYHINSLGEDSIAAFTAYFRIEVLTMYSPLMALGQTVMFFCGQNQGAGKPDRARQGTVRGLLIAVTMAVVCASAALMLSDVLFRAFNRDPDVIAIGRQVIRIAFPLYFLYSATQILGDSLRGFGDAKGPMLVIAFNICIFRTLLLMLIAPRYQDVRGIALTYPITWVVTLLCMTIHYIWYHRKHRAADSQQGSVSVGSEE